MINVREPGSTLIPTWICSQACERVALHSRCGAKPKQPCWVTEAAIPDHQGEAGSLRDRPSLWCSEAANLDFFSYRSKRLDLQRSTSHRLWDEPINSISIITNTESTWTPMNKLDLGFSGTEASVTRCGSISIAFPFLLDPWRTRQGQKNNLVS
jgi:hypothetical protein